MTDPTGMGVFGVYFYLYKFIIKATGCEKKRNLFTGGKIRQVGSVEKGFFFFFVN